MCVSFLLLLGACSFPHFSEIPEPIREFTADIRLNTAGRTFEGTLSCLSYVDVRFAISSPEGLEGFEVRLTPEGCVCDVLGMTDRIFSEQIPENACVRLLLEGVRDAVFTTDAPTPNANGAYNADVDNGKYRAVFRSDGSLSLLYTSDHSLSVVFSDVSPLTS